MAKINVSIPDDVLHDAEKFAAEMEMSRSGFVAEATARYVTEVRTERERAERRRSIAEAIASARRLAEHVGTADTTAIIRRDRDRDSVDRDAT
jgi:metal-responsive CopG/Arc/MetJ family transcriptional regulator